MDVITIGPAALPLSRLFALIGIAVFLIAGWIAGRRYPEMSGWETGALIAGVVLSRLVYVLMHLEAFRAEPITVLYFWQGGFSAAGMILGGAGWAVWRLRRRWSLLVPAATAISPCSASIR